MLEQENPAIVWGSGLIVAAMTRRKRRKKARCRRRKEYPAAEMHVPAFALGGTTSKNGAVGR